MPTIAWVAWGGFRPCLGLPSRAPRQGQSERGSPWWSDGAVDMNRRMAVNTPYADGYRGLQDPSADVQ